MSQQTDTRRKVVVTGLGLTTSLGDDIDENWKGMCGGASGAQLIDHFNVENLKVRFACLVSRNVTQAPLTRTRTIDMARRVLSELMDTAELTKQELSGARWYHAFPQTENEWFSRLDLIKDKNYSLEAIQLLDEAARSRYERFASGHFPITKELSREYALRYPPVIVTTACASSASVLQMALEDIRMGLTDRAVVVGSDSTVSPEGITRFNLLSALSTDNDTFRSASRPFTKTRNGFVMGEGAGAILLESSELAARRRARQHAELVGAGDYTDNFHRTRSTPDGSGIERCVQSALDSAGIAKEQVSFINAHGTSTPENDKMEYRGLARLFGDGRIPPITSNKSSVGHTLSAAGIVEAVFSILSLSKNVVSPTINHDALDEEFDLDVVANRPREMPVDYALSNSFGFGGQNVSLVFGKPK